MPLDELTKLYNRRDLFNGLSQEIARTKRSGDPFSVLMIDVDHFKEVNDNFGHLRGDRILVQLAQILKDNCREMDVACRYGGDEFVIILPETDRWSAEIAAKRLLTSVKSFNFSGYKDQPDLNLTISIGIATFPTDLGTTESLIQRADEALYRSKRTGRNRITKDVDISEEAKAPPLNFTGFVNRIDELDFLKTKMSKAIKKEGSFVIVNGEAGIGKTRLVTELNKFCAMQKVVFLTAKPFEFGVTPPYHIFFQIITDYLQKVGMTEVRFLSELQPIYKATLVKFLPDLRITMNKIEEPSRLSPLYEKMRLFDAVYRILEIISNKSSLLLFLDDLQWIREADLEIFGYLLRNIKNLPILICGAYRIEEVSEDHTLNHFLRIISREHRYDKIELAGLSNDDTRELLRTILTYPVPENVSEKVFQETNGNPFYIEEILKSLVDEGSIYWEDTKWNFKDIQRISLPTSVGDLLLQRLEKVDPDLKELVSKASVIGNNFLLSLLKELTKMNEGHLLDLLDLGIKALLINAEPDDNYSFSNLLIQRTLYEDISPIIRKRMHSNIARALEVLFAGNISEIYEKLAHHYLMAEEWQSAFDFNFKAAEKLKGIYANHDAISRYHICLDLIKNGKVSRPKTEIEIYKGLASINSLIGNSDEAIKYYKVILKRDDLDMKDRAEVMLDAGSVYERMADFDSALACYNEGKTMLDKDEHKIERAKLDIASMNIYMRRGDFETIQELASITLEIFKEADCFREIARVYSTLGSMHLDKGEWEAAEKYHLKSLEYMKKGGDEFSISSVLNNLGNVYHRTFQFDKAVEYHSEVLEIRKKIGDRSGVASSLNNLAIIFDETGDWDKCFDYHNRSLEISKSINATRQISLSYNNIGYLLLKIGDFNKAADYLLQSLEISERIRDLNRIASTQNNLGYAYLGMGWIDESTKMLKKAEETCSKYDFKTLLTENFRIQAEVNLESDKIENAIKFVNKAHDIAKKIDDKGAMVEAILVSGRILLIQNKLAEAIAKFDECSSIAQSIRNKFDNARGCYYRALAMKKEGDAEGAQEYLIKAKLIFDSLGAKRYLKMIETST